MPCFRRVQGLVHGDFKTNAPAQTSMNSDSIVPLILSCFFVTICVVTRPTSTFPLTSLSVELGRVSFKHQLSPSSKSTEQAALRTEELTLGTGVCYE